MLSVEQRTQELSEDYPILRDVFFTAKYPGIVTSRLKDWE